MNRRYEDREKNLVQRLHCMDDRCKYCNYDNECTAEKVELSAEGVSTQFQGYRRVLSCDTFEKSDLCKQIEAFMEEQMK